MQIVQDEIIVNQGQSQLLSPTCYRCGGASSYLDSHIIKVRIGTSVSNKVERQIHYDPELREVISILVEKKRYYQKERKVTVCGSCLLTTDTVIP